MSDYTWGVLFLKPNLRPVEQQIQGFVLPFIVRELNDKWGALFVEGDKYEYPPVSPKILEISREIPLLFFQHPEDHGWGYALCNGGAVIALLWVAYDLGWNMTLELAQQRYPEVEDYFGGEFYPWQELMDEVLASDAYRNECIQQYSYLNLKELQIFGLSAADIKMLEEAISPDTCFNWESLHAQSQVFKEVLGIKEMSWMSYRYLMKRGDDAE